MKAESYIRFRIPQFLPNNIPKDPKTKNPTRTQMGEGREAELPKPPQMREVKPKLPRPPPLPQTPKEVLKYLAKVNPNAKVAPLTTEV